MYLLPYPKYKPSGVEWLGDVPEHWESRRFGYLFRFYSGGTPSTSESELWDGDLPWVSSKDMKSMVISDTEDHISEEAVCKSSTCKMPANSLLMVNRSGILRHSIPAAIITREMAINQDIRGCVPVNGVDPKFIAYLIEGNQPALLALWRQQGATVESLTFESVKTTNLHLPDLTEQQSIAAFLDRETGRMDRLMAKKRELIERLKEKRTALISRTVTRGLPPAAARAAGLPANPPLKPSGLDWLGDIPKHWDVKQLKWAIKFQRGHDLPSDEREEGSIPLVTSAGTSAFISKAAAKGPGIVTGRYGTIGEFYLVETDYWPLNTSLYSIELRGNNISFLRYMLMHLSPLFLLNANKSAVPGVDRNDIHPTMTAVPPLPEQTAIAAHLDKETAKLDALVGKVEEAVERLQEYRTALITAAVTGKIDVRMSSLNGNYCVDTEKGTA